MPHRTHTTSPDSHASDGLVSAIRPASSLTATATHATDPRPHVVIVGGGFAGLSAAKALADAPVRITLLDRTNHHLFQPLLYQVATAVLNPADISVPIRWLLRKQRNATVVMADVDRIDPHGKTVSLDSGTVLLSYDFLVMAAGARHAYFGHPEWEQHAPGLKSLEDALEMRRRFLLSFEAAERASAAGERDALLTFVIVGGGPTGVELAGMIPEVTHHALNGEFRRIDPRKARVLLLEGGPRILPAFPEELSARAQRDLESLGVEIRTNCIVTHVDSDGVVAGGERIDAHTVFWGAGNQASPLARQLGAPTDRAGRVVVNPDLSVPGHPEIFCAGDIVATTTPSGTPVPAVAPAANQMGTLVGRNIAARVAGRDSASFRYLNKGDLATIGRHKAVAVIAGQQLHGLFAWLTWLFVHILYLVGVRNRVTVFVQWGYQYLTFQRGVRLITGTTVHRLLKASKAAHEKRRVA
jgi:NADH:ubiquinone reductase (H+-translocating)